MSRDKQLCNIRLEDVLEKRGLEQPLNAKEFAVLNGISYSTAREWFRSPGFPVFRGMVFWQDFVLWRIAQNGTKIEAAASAPKTAIVPHISLPPRAAKILSEA